MPFIFNTAIYPSDKAQIVAQRFLEVTQQNPPDESIAKTVVQSAVKRTNEGLKVVTVAEVSPGKLEEALARSAAIISQFDDIEGLEFSTDVYMAVGEALTSIGVELPG